MGHLIKIDLHTEVAIRLITPRTKELQVLNLINKFQERGILQSILMLIISKTNKSQGKFLKFLGKKINQLMLYIECHPKHQISIQCIKSHKNN